MWIADLVTTLTLSYLSLGTPKDLEENPGPDASQVDVTLGLGSADMFAGKK
jgi:hypothetical protein